MSRGKEQRLKDLKVKVETVSVSDGYGRLRRAYELILRVVVPAVQCTDIEEKCEEPGIKSSSSEEQ